MTREKNKLLPIIIILAAVVSFAGGLIFGPVLIEMMRGGETEASDEPEPHKPDPGEALRLADLVRQAAEEHRAEPVGAKYNSAYNIVLPELNGYEMDQEATLARLAEAEPGQPVTPVWRELKAGITAADYPTAVIDRGNPARLQVTLMINVAWGNEYLPEMLDVLEQQGVTTTFFPVGRWAERFPELLGEIYSRGHECGNHGYSDSEVFSGLDYPAAVESLRKANEVVARITGQTPRWFTPHKGEYNPAALEAAAAQKMRLLLWTLDTVDWQKPGEEVMARRILDNLVPGAIILMHPTEQSAGFLRLVLPEIKAQGYEVVTMSTLLSPSPICPKIFLQR